MIDSFRHIIELWESREAMAEDLPGVTPTMVSKWWQRDNIPSEHWQSVLETRRAKRGGVTSALVVRLGSRHSLEARA